jgi:hypothetical protein
LSLSTDGGLTFTNKTTADGLGDNTVNGVFASGSTVYAATDGGLSISTNGGDSFTNRTTTNSGLGRNDVYGVFASGSTVYAATGGGLSISTDGGATFNNTTTANGLGADYVTGVFASDSKVYAATFGGLSFDPFLTGVSVALSDYTVNANSTATLTYTTPTGSDPGVYMATIYFPSSLTLNGGTQAQCGAGNVTVTVGAAAYTPGLCYFNLFGSPRLTLISGNAIPANSDIVITIGSSKVTNGSTAGSASFTRWFTSDGVGNTAIDQAYALPSVTLVAPPGAPTIGTATAGAGSASVAFIAPASNGGATITGYTVTSSPGGITAGGNGFTTSPINVTGLTNGVAYTFTVTATNSAGTGSASAASNSVTPVAPVAPVTPPADPIPTVIPPPQVPGVGSNLLSPLNLSSGNGPAMTNCLLDSLRGVIGPNAAFLGQASDGSAGIGQTGLVVSFYALGATTRTSYGLGQGAGFYLQGSNPLNVVTSCGTFTTVPAMYNLGGWGAFLNSMGLSAQFNIHGVMIVVVGGITYVARPDYVVTQGAPGAPGLVTGSDGLMRFTDGAGNTQILYPAFIDPEVLANQIAQATGGSVVIQTDGTALLTLWSGQKFVLTPEMTLGGVPPEQFAAGWWQDGPNHFRYRTYSFSSTSQGFTVRAVP